MRKPAEQKRPAGAKFARIMPGRKCENRRSRNGQLVHSVRPLTWCLLRYLQCSFCKLPPPFCSAPAAFSPANYAHWTWDSQAKSLGPRTGNEPGSGSGDRKKGDEGRRRKSRHSHVRLKTEKNKGWGVRGDGEKQGVQTEKEARSLGREREREWGRSLTSHFHRFWFQREHYLVFSFELSIWKHPTGQTKISNHWGESDQGPVVQSMDNSYPADKSPIQRINFIHWIVSVVWSLDSAIRRISSG